MLLVSHKARLEFLEFLSLHGYDYILTVDNPNLDKRVADHPDLSVFAFANGDIVIDKNLFSYYGQYLRSKKLIKGDKASLKYPYDSIYNVYQGSDFFIHNSYTENHILSYMKESSYKFYEVNQGYTRCSIIPMGDKILTADYGIYKTLKDKIELVLLKQENIGLDGFDNGFIGGTCGLVDNTLIFNGNIKQSINFPIIEREAYKSNIKLLYPDLPLVDLGSILNL